MATIIAPTAPYTVPPEPPRQSGSRTAWVAVGGIVAALTVAWGTFATVDALAHERSHTTATITTPVHTVDVDNSAGPVTIQGTSAAAVTIDTSLSHGIREPVHREEIQGDRLMVRAHCPAFTPTFCSVSYRILVPADTTLVVRASGGGITLSGLRGSVDASSSGGGVRVTDMGGALRLRSSGGRVNGTVLRSDQVDASSSGGSVRLSFADPPTALRASSSGGGVTIVLPDTPDAYRVAADSSGGSARTLVRTDPTSSRTIRATSSGGSVTVRYPSASD